MTISLSKKVFLIIKCLFYFDKMLQRSAYSSICRTCLTENCNMKSIFKNEKFIEPPITLHDMLITCASIQILKDDGLPEQICLNCVQEMKKAYLFRKLCERSDEKLKNHLHSFLTQKQEKYIIPKDNCESNSSNKIFIEHNNFSECNTNIATLNDSDEENNEKDTYTQNKFKTGTLNLKQKAYCCKICNEIYVGLEAYKEHTTIFHENFVNLSSQEFVTELTLESSQKIVDQPQNSSKKLIRNKACSVRKRNPPRTCPICNKTFPFHSDLERHKVIHTGEKPYLCNICGKGFAQVSYLKIHSFIHSGEKPYKCQTCEKSFSAPGTLVTHIRTHTGERPHICKICGKKFPQSGNLSSHMRTHTGEKSAECKVCHRQFNRQGRLKIHMRIHSGERPYSCKECGRNFAVNGTLKKHIRTHTGEKPYICSVCGQAFAQNGTLATHMKIHKTK